jgi:GNAT superfamily N-acetyltransferase
VTSHGLHAADSLTDVLALYDEQLRRGAAAEPPGRIERDGPVVRHVSDDAAGWDGVLWAGLDPTDASAADAQISRQLDYFRRRGRPFEWKYHDYDQPADLPDRLIAAGLRPEAPEALMVAAVDSLAPDHAGPGGIDIVEVTDATGVELVVALHNEVFGIDHRWLRDELLAQLAAGGAAGVAVLALSGSDPVSSGRVSFHAGTDFASLWGGGTLPQWRGRGIYRALVAYRARLARDRGFTYVTVDALPTSEPILQRLGFVRLCTTTPYVWAPSVS